MNVLHKLKTTEEQQCLLADDAAYRQTVTATTWSRYVTLGRPTTTGFNFDKIWNNFENDPLLLYQLIWYTFLFHVDRKLDVPIKLNHWAMTIVQPYLAIHSPDKLTIHTLQITWNTIQNAHEPWIPVGNTKRNTSQTKMTERAQNNKLTLLTRLNTRKTAKEPPKIPSIPEDETENNMDWMENTSAEHDNVSKASSDAKQSALIPNLNVSLNDGTHRVTFRMQIHIDTNDMAKATNEAYNTIHEFLATVFHEKDGHIYRWTRDDLTEPRAIEDMSQHQLRTYMPEIALVPSKSIVVFNIRFDFQNLNPTIWRNKPLTKEIFDNFKVKATISNSKSTSGKLVVAGYILLKSPNHTHRVRYTQSLRSKLPKETPGFDLLLHRRTSLDQKIDHLVVQCGENHVHPLSNAILNLLDGKSAGVYVPRFAFASMSPEEVKGIFAKHDNYVKSQKLIMLSPFIANLDTIRTEQGPNKKVRSTREWATSLMTTDGTNIKCDVVNGGFDQRAYLLVPQQYEQIALTELEQYKSRIFPFSQREARFRETIGPPSVIHVSSKIKSSLEVFETLPSSEVWKRAPKAVRQEISQQQSELTTDHSSISTSETRSATSQESISSHKDYSLQTQQDRSQNQPKDQQKTRIGKVTTSQTTASTRSGTSATLNSTYDACFHQLELMFKKNRP